MITFAEVADLRNFIRSEHADGYVMPDDADILRLCDEVERLRLVMQRVYEDGVRRRGNSHAAMVEPLWKALQEP